MALKGALTFAEMVARLIRGYVRETGKQPDNLAKLKINMEAAERIKQQNVVTEFPKDKITPFNEPRPGEKEFIPKPNVAPIKKFLSDKEATAQINKLRENFDFNDRKQVLQLFDDIDAGKAFGAFDDIQRKELRDMISDMYTRKPEFASGGLARVGMVVGGSVWKKFIEQLFMKSSNNIRQGKGLFKGLTQEQMITQHDNLTKMLKKWEMSGKKGLPEGAEKYLGVNDLQVSKAIKEATSEVDINNVLNKAYDEVAGGSGFSDDYKMAADQLSDSIAEQLGKNFDDLSETQQRQIQNIALKRTTQDLKKRLSQQTAEGIQDGTIDISDPKVAEEFTTFIKKSDPEGFKDIEQKIQLEGFDVTGRKKNAYGGIAGQLHLNEGGRARFQTGGNSLAYVSTPSNYRPMPSNLTYEQAVQWNKEEKNRQEALSRAQYQKMQAMTDPNFQIDYDKFQQAYDKGLTKKYGQMDWVQDYSPYELYDEFYIDPDTGAKKKNIFTDFDNMGAGSINRYEDLANRLSRNTYGYWNEMGNQLTDPTYVSVRDNLRDIIASDAGKQMITYKDSNREPGWQPRTLASIAEGRLSDLTAAQRNKLSRENSRRYDELMVQTQPGYARNVTAYNRRPGNFLDKALAPNQSMSDYLTQAGDVYGLTTDQLWNYNPSAYKEVAHTPKSKAINVMMNEKGNVMKDQSMAELARETGMAPGITNLPINNMSDMQRMIGPGESIAEGTAYNPLVDPRMQAAADKGMDARMGRTYAENKQIMADKRMLQAKGGLAKILGV